MALLCVILLVAVIVHTGALVGPLTHFRRSAGRHVLNEAVNADVCKKVTVKTVDSVFDQDKDEVFFIERDVQVNICSDTDFGRAHTSFGRLERGSQALLRYDELLDGDVLTARPTGAAGTIRALEQVRKNDDRIREVQVS